MRNFLKSIAFYQAVKGIMDENQCNSFTIECREVCPLEMGEKYQFTPCMAHSLLKDAGCPSACQTDVNAILAMMALMYTSKKSSYLGNPEFIAEGNILKIWHSVPSLKMNGFNSPLLPYEIRNFTEAGWGATLRYDFSRDKGQIVTLGRFNPACTKMQVTNGVILRGYGAGICGCTLGVEIQVGDVMEVFESQKDFGSHLVMVYGDYAEQVQRLGEIMNFDVVMVG